MAHDYGCGWYIIHFKSFLPTPIDCLARALSFYHQPKEIQELLHSLRLTTCFWIDKKGERTKNMFSKTFGMRARNCLSTEIEQLKRLVDFVSAYSPFSCKPSHFNVEIFIHSIFKCTPIYFSFWALAIGWIWTVHCIYVKSITIEREWLRDFKRFL